MPVIDNPSKILLTGGSGRLGTELLRLLTGVVAPQRAELDVSDPSSVSRAIDRYHPEVIVHAAAYTNVAGGEVEKSSCWRVNVVGTRNLVMQAVARGIFLIHISTDYVFEGTTGNYAEDDPVGPVLNYYALSKLVAEEVVRVAPRHLVIRTSFRPREWPYPSAFEDVYTSQDYVDIIAPKIAAAILRYDEIPYRTLHIATERKSVLELALRRKGDVLQGSKITAGVSLPDDISLNVSRWEALEEKWKEGHRTNG